jgi:pyrroloquinoline-quinone synthase
MITGIWLDRPGAKTSLKGMEEPSDSVGQALMDQVEFRVGRSAIMGNRYFSALKEGTMSRDAFVRSQKQFFFAVRYFSRPMAALMARMPDSSTRQGLIHNLSEEHGFEDDGPSSAGFDPSVAHDLTFLAFLRTLGIESGEMALEREGPGVRAFNTALMGCCLMERTELAFGCLGVIEYAFADICELIGKKVVENGWIAPDDLVHYKLHAQIDKRHAADFFKVVETAWQGEGRSPIEDGIILGLYLFDRLYEDLDPLKDPDHGK